ncbi:MAG TPA: glycosyltransferase family 4 protein [Chitinophagaceae bacterium]|jgi:glycosyltransferase involved in cell wall biosynthesis|nr:glycosyltransferase family 4 protein [Chitinophagaceae bacterium]
MKKVLAIAPYYYLPFFSGGQKSLARFFEHLGNETSLKVISVPENDPSLTGSYTILPLLKSSFSRYIDRSLIATITTLVKKEGIDTIICEHPYFAWLVFAIKKRTGINVVIHAHNIEYQRFRSLGKWWWPVLKGYEKRSFRKADRLFFVAPEDRDFATGKWGIAKDKCVIVPFGIDISSFPEDRAKTREAIASLHGIAPREKILSFNGLLDYKPNTEALNVILNTINPLLLRQNSFRYKIIISGKRLPVEFNSLEEYTDKNIIYTGFVEDITAYFKATDIFLNPILSGGGIKTKMVEAIGYGATVVSTENGAAGLDKNICGDKLLTVPDNNWDLFVKTIIENIGHINPTPSSYYNMYYWGAIVKRLFT